MSCRTKQNDRGKVSRAAGDGEALNLTEDHSPRRLSGTLLQTTDKPKRGDLKK